MPPRARHRGLAITLLAPLVVAGCGAPAVVVRSTPTVASGDLPPAVPSSEVASNRGRTGRAARVVLGARREQVLELYTRYVRGLQNRSVDELRPLFDENLVGIEESEPVSRDVVIAYHERLMQLIDMSALGEVLAAEPPAIRSMNELRRDSRSAPGTMLPGDWLIERGQPSRTSLIRGGGSLSLLNALPRRLIVRWSGDRPLIYGVPDSMVRNR